MVSTTGTSDSGDEHLRLMRKAIQGDPSAFCDLYAALSPRVLRSLAANNGQDSIEDLFQETIGRFWQGQADFRGQSTVLTFVLGIAANVIREHEATRQRSPEQTCSPEVVRECIDQESLAAYQHQNGEDPAEWLTKLLATLPPKQREALDLVCYQGLTASQAAQQSGCSLKTFCDRLYRAKRTLKERMTAMGSNSARTGSRARKMG